MRVINLLRISALSVVIASVAAASVPVSSHASSNQPIDVSGLSIIFPNTSVVGAGAETGDSFDYVNVAEVAGTTISAKVTVLEVVNAVASSSDCPGPDFAVRRVDRLVDSPDSNDPLRTNLRVCADSVGYAEIGIEFLVGGSAQPLTNLKANFEDVDNRQFLWVYGVDSFRLPNGTLLTVDDVPASGSDPRITKFVGPTGSADAIEGAAEVTWNQASTIRFRFGIDRAGESSTTGNLVLFFEPAAFESANNLSQAEQTQQAPQKKESPREPAIALTPLFGLGEVACSNRVVTNGEGLMTGSARSLTLTRVSGALDSGFVSGSAFESTVTMPGTLTPGSYTLTLAATGRDGSALSLSRTFSIDSSCVVSALGSTSGTTLAQTGPSTSLRALSVGLVSMLFGVAVLGMARRRRVTTGQI